MRGLQIWCRENFVHRRNLLGALDVRRQLVELCGRMGVALTSNSDSEALRRALVRGLCYQTAEHVGEGMYRTVSTDTCYWEECTFMMCSS